MKIIGVLEGLRLAAEEGVQFIELETDSIEVVRI